MSSAIDVLSAPRSSLREEHRMALSHRPANIHSLPVELLTAIFVLGSGFDYPYIDSPFLLKPDQEYNPPIPANFATAVSHVCRHWRQIALSIRSLWTTIHVREKSHIARAMEYLSRCSASRNYLIDILVDTVAMEDHTPGITLCREEIDTIFGVIIPFVKTWRSFHLKICDDECKGVARRFLTSCGSAPNLETLQLYHFEDYRTTHNLYIATYRPPVTIFDNDVPQLKNVSLIGVNLPWDRSPYLSNLINLELALHLDNIRPPYKCWDYMLRSSPQMKTLCLHYSGPKEATGAPALAWSSLDDKITLANLRELSLADLDPGYLCNLMERLEIRSLTKLTLNLRDQDFTPFIELLTAPQDQISLPITKHTSSEKLSLMKSSSDLQSIHRLSKLESLIIHGLECSPIKWATLLRAIPGLRILKVDFNKVPPGFWKVIAQESESFPGVDRKTKLPKIQCNGHQTLPVLPCLEVFEMTGISGKEITAALRHRYLYPREGSLPSEKWIVKWNERRRHRDHELDALVDKGFWIPNNGGRIHREAKVLIDAFDDDDDEIEEVEDDHSSVGDESESGQICSE